MALIKIDWDPGPKRVRQFGLLLVGFSAMVSGWFWWRGGPAVLAMTLGGGLGAVVAARPEGAGLWIYKAWMSFAFVMGTVVSNAILALLYFGMITPLGLFFRLKGRDALNLRPRGKDSEWVPLSIPEDKTYFERLF